MTEASEPRFRYWPALVGAVLAAAALVFAGQLRTAGRQLRSELDSHLTVLQVTSEPAAA